MKRFLLIAICSVPAFYASAQLQYIEGVGIITDSYAHKISHDGSQILGEEINGGSTYFNRVTNTSYYYAQSSFGQGYVVADNGWVVGAMNITSENQRPVIMADGELIYPEVFNPSVSATIHSITPDASRICGISDNIGPGSSKIPFYCDIDANGNFGEIKTLPTPPTDFFGARPQYCSATWMSDDGKIIAGQVVDARGFFVYPIIYTQDSEGTWSYSLPSEKLFNQKGLTVPSPLGDMDDEYPDAPYPEITDFMTPMEVMVWNAALQEWEASGFNTLLDPYEHLWDYMADYEAYYEAGLKYNEALEEYSLRNEEYMATLFEIASSSVFFVRNAMALSADGLWLASSAQIDDFSDPEFPVGYYVPYLFNLSTGEIKKIGKDGDVLVTNQVLPGGNVISTTPAGEILPPRSFIYLNNDNITLPVNEYIGSLIPAYGEWYLENLTAEMPVDIDEDGQLIYETVTITGRVSASEDFTVICGGVDLSSSSANQLITYIMDGLPSGIDRLNREEELTNDIRIYNLQGVFMGHNLDNLPKGIYIVNGKKMAVTK